jgi:hypothetical protein
MRTACFLVGLVGLAQGLLPGASLVRNAPSRASSVRMGSDAAVAKKAAVVEEVKEVMSKSALMFAVSTETLTVNEMNEIRQKYPEDITIRCLKNTLVKRAAEDYPNFQGADSLLESSNYWFFVPEESMRTSVSTWNDFVKDKKKVRGAAPRSLLLPPLPPSPAGRAQPRHARARRSRVRMRVRRAG